MSARRSPAPRFFLALTLAASMLLLLLAHHCEAQVNFSPSWGKRAPGGGSGAAGAAAALAGAAADNPCRSSVESLLYIYKLVQSEAQKMLNCEKFTE